MTPREFFQRKDAPRQTEVAEKTGIKRSALNHYVSGRRRPSPEDAAKIALATGEPSLYTYWYPNLKQQLERMELADQPLALEGEERIGG